MAGTADILAGRAFVQLYVRDHAFRQQLADNAALVDEFASYAGEAGGAAMASGYGSADGAMEMMYQNTLYLTEATDALNQVLMEVMDTYMGLAEMQQEGITLSAAGPGGGDAGGSKLIGLAETVGKSVIVGAGNAIGGQIEERFASSDLVQKGILEPLENAFPRLFGKTSEALVGIEHTPLGGGGESGAIMAELVSAGTAAGEAAPIMAELVSNTADAGVVMAELVSPAAAAATSTTSMATSAVTASASTSTLSTALRFLYTTILPLLAIILAITAAFVAFKIAVAAIKLPFQIAGMAINATVFAIKTLTTVSIAAVRLLYQLGETVAFAAGRFIVFAASTAKAFAGGVLDTITSGIESIGAAVAGVGNVMSMIGSSMNSLAQRVIGPLTQAANMFQEHGETVSRLSKGYKIAAETASVYSYIAGQMNKAVGERGGQSGGGMRMMENRIKGLMATVKEGTPEFERWRKQAEAAGLILGGSGVASALAMDDAMDRMRDSIKGLWVQLGSAVAPMIIEVTEIMAGAVRGVTSWIRQNQGLVSTVFRVAKVVAGMATAIGFAGTALVTIGGAISPFTAALAAVAAGLAIVEYRTGAARSMWDAYKGSVVSVYNTIMQYLSPMVAFVQDVLAGIYNALKAGDLALAAQIAWSGLKLAWIDGLLWLSERTTGTFNAILQNLAAGNWKAAADGAVGMMMSAWLWLQNAMDRVWINILNFADETLMSLVNTVDGRVAQIHNAVAPTWALIQKGAEGVWESVKTSFSSAMEMFGVFAESMKTFGQTFIDWVIKPFALMHPTVGIALAALEKYLAATAKDFGGAFTSTADVIEQKWKSKKSGSLTEAETAQLAKEAEARTNASDSRQAANKDAYTKRSLDREQELRERIARRNEEIARQQARGGAGSSGVIARLLADNARDKLQADMQAAESQMQEMAQPDEPNIKKEGKVAGLVTSSAYAMQMVGSGISGESSNPVARALTRAQKLEETRQKKEEKWWDNMLKRWDKANEKQQNPIWLMEGGSGA